MESSIELMILVRKSNRGMYAGFRLSGIAAALTFDLGDEPACSSERFHSVE